MRSPRFALIGILLVLVGSACKDGSKGTQAQADARKALETFLDSRVGVLWSPPLPETDSICIPETIASRNVVLDAYQVLPGNALGDTVTIPVITKLVAVQEEWGPEDHLTRVSVGRTEDTLHWRVVKYPDAKFRVCGYSVEGVDLGLLGAGSIVWAPVGASLDSVHTLLHPRP